MSIDQSFYQTCKELETVMKNPKEKPIDQTEQQLIAEINYAVDKIYKEHIKHIENNAKYYTSPEFIQHYLIPCTKNGITCHSFTLYEKELSEDLLKIYDNYPREYHYVIKSNILKHMCGKEITCDENSLDSDVKKISIDHNNLDIRNAGFYLNIDDLIKNTSSEMYDCMNKQYMEKFARCYLPYLPYEHQVYKILKSFNFRFDSIYYVLNVDNDINIVLNNCDLLSKYLNTEKEKINKLFKDNDSNKFSFKVELEGDTITYDTSID